MKNSTLYVLFVHAVLIEDDIGEVELTQKLLERMQGDKVKEVRRMLDVVGRLYSLYRDGLIEEPDTSIIKQAILERLIEEEVQNV
jgi:hypothetical protein